MTIKCEKCQTCKIQDSRGRHLRGELDSGTRRGRNGENGHEGKEERHAREHIINTATGVFNADVYMSVYH